jgi:hypothetical protein
MIGTRMGGREKQVGRECESEWITVAWRKKPIFFF